MATNSSLLSSIAQIAYNYPTTGILSLLKKSTQKKDKTDVLPTINLISSPVVSPNLPKDLNPPVPQAAPIKFKNLISAIPKDAPFTPEILISPEPKSSSVIPEKDETDVLPTNLISSPVVSPNLPKNLNPPVPQAAPIKFKNLISAIPKVAPFTPEILISPEPESSSVIPEKVLTTSLDTLNPIPVKPPNISSKEDTKEEELTEFEKQIKEYLEKMKETPWFYPTPWQNYPEPPKTGVPSPYNVDFYAALKDPIGYLTGKYAGGTIGIRGDTSGGNIWYPWIGTTVKISGKEAVENYQKFLDTVKDFASASGAIHSSDPNFQKWMYLLNQYGLSYTKIPTSDGYIYKPMLPQELLNLQNQVWKENIEKYKNSILKNALGIAFSTPIDPNKPFSGMPEKIVLQKNTPDYAKYIEEAKKLGFTVQETDQGATIFLKPPLEGLVYEGPSKGQPPPLSPTAYSTYVPMFPDLGINPKTGLPYTQEEFNKLPDYQKVAIWMSQLLGPTGQISSAYQMTLAEALAGQRATIDQLSSVISKYSGRFDEAWGIGEKATQMMERAGAKVSSLLGEAENIIKQAGRMYLQATAETKPMFQQLYKAAADIYNKANQLASFIAGTSASMTQDLWNQYGDIYNRIMQSYMSTQTGYLAPETQRWLDLLRDVQTQAVTETLGKYYEEKQRQLIDELVGRGIVSSKTAASALADLGEAVAEQLRQAQYQILADYAKQALELPFKQYEASLGLLQIPQTGASLMETARRELLSYTEPLNTALAAIAQGRGAASDLASTLMSAARGYQGVGSELASMAPSYFLPAQNLLTAARTLSSMAAEGLGAEKAALETQYAMWEELPENLRKAFFTYGGLVQNLLSILAEMELGDKRLRAAERQAKRQEMIGLISAIANIFG